MDAIKAAEALAALAVALSKSSLVKNRRKGLKVYKNCVVGSDTVDWLLKQHIVTEREDAITMGKAMVVEGFLSHVTHSHTFEDKSYLYYVHPDGPPAGGAGGNGGDASAAGGRTKGRAVSVTVDLRETFVHPGPPYMPERDCGAFAVYPARKSVGQTDSDRDLVLRLVLEDVNPTLTLFRAGKIAKVWPVSQIESFGGSTEPCYMRFEFKDDPAIEILAHQSWDVAQMRDLMRRTLCLHSVHTEEWRKIGYCQIVDVTEPVKGKRLLLLSRGMIFRYAIGDSSNVEEIIHSCPESVQPMHKTDVWSNETELLVHLKDKLGNRLSFKCTSADDTLTWKKALVQASTLSKHECIASDSANQQLCESSKGAWAVRRAAVLNHEVYFSFAIRVLDSAEATPFDILHVSFERDTLEICSNEQVRSRWPLGDIDSVTPSLSNPRNLTITISGGFELRFEVAHLIDAALIRKCLEVEIARNSQASIEFPDVLLELKGSREAVLLNINMRMRRIEFFQDVTLKVSYPFLSIHKVSKSKAKAKVLTLLVSTDAANPTARVIVNVTARNQNDRDRLFGLLETAIKGLAERDVFRGETLRIIRKSGFVEEAINKDKEKKKKEGLTRRFVMITPSKLFIFRESKGVWCPLDAICIQGMKCVTWGRTISVRNREGTILYEFVTDTQENASDWMRLLNVETIRTKLPDPTKITSRLQHDDEVNEEQNEWKSRGLEFPPDVIFVPTGPDQLPLSSPPLAGAQEDEAVAATVDSSSSNNNKEGGAEEDVEKEEEEGEEEGGKEEDDGGKEGGESGKEEAEVAAVGDSEVTGAVASGDEMGEEEEQLFLREQEELAKQATQAVDEGNEDEDDEDYLGFKDEQVVDAVVVVDDDKNSSLIAQEDLGFDDDDEDDEEVGPPPPEDDFEEEEEEASFATKDGARNSSDLPVIDDAAASGGEELPPPPSHSEEEDIASPHSDTVDSPEKAQEEGGGGAAAEETPASVHSENSENEEEYDDLSDDSGAAATTGADGVPTKRSIRSGVKKPPLEPKKEIAGANSAEATKVLTDTKDSLRHTESSQDERDGKDGTSTAWDVGDQYDFSQVLSFFKKKDTETVGSMPTVAEVTEKKEKKSIFGFGRKK